MKFLLLQSVNEKSRRYPIQSFEQELALIVSSSTIEPPPPPKTVLHKEVELHLHTKMSGLDGVTDVEEAVKQAAFGGIQRLPLLITGLFKLFLQHMGLARSMESR